MDKLTKLVDYLKMYEKICVAYSGGVDSDLVLNASVMAIGHENVIAVIGDGVMLRREDLEDAKNLATKANVKYYIIKADAFSVPEFKNNDKQRCYFCKKNIMGGVIKKAQELGFDIVADGKNADDAKVYRPGAKASHELGIISPLSEADMSKADIRAVAKQMELSTWNKASNSCLATRFPYDSVLSEENFEMVEKAEKLIAKENIPSARLRYHGEIARIEIPKDYFEVFMGNKKLHEAIKALGFRYITLDLEGFRSGSMD